MEHPVGDMIVLDEIEYLGLVDVSRIGAGMEDTIHIKRERLPIPLGRMLIVRPPMPIPVEGCHR